MDRVSSRSVEENLTLKKYDKVLPKVLPTKWEEHHDMLVINVCHDSSSIRIVTVRNYSISDTKEFKISQLNLIK